MRSNKGLHSVPASTYSPDSSLKRHVASPSFKYMGAPDRFAAYDSTRLPGPY